MLIRDVMQKHVITAEADLTIEEAASIMVDNHIGCLVVMNNGSVTGIVTERDVLRYVGIQKQVGDKTIADIMTNYLHTIAPQQKLESAVALMKEHGIKKLPVMDGKDLVGIITATDIMVNIPSVIGELKSLLRKE